MAPRDQANTVDIDQHCRPPPRALPEGGMREPGTLGEMEGSCWGACSGREALGLGCRSLGGRAKGARGGGKLRAALPRAGAPCSCRWHNPARWGRWSHPRSGFGRLQQALAPLSDTLAANGLGTACISPCLQSLRCPCQAPCSPCPRSRVCTARCGLIRKYHLFVCRRCFRERAAQIGFLKLN